MVVPGVVDYTEKADEAYRRFAEAGMHVVRSTILSRAGRGSIRQEKERNDVCLWSWLCYKIALSLMRSDQL